MSQIKFTDRKIATLSRPPKGQIDYFDERESGFGVRVSMGGTKTWFYKYVFSGKQRRLSMGQYPAISLAKARTMVLSAKHDVVSKTDPAAQKLTAIREEREAPTFYQLAGEYIERHAKKRKRTWQEDQRIIDTYLGDWHDRKAADISRREVIDLLDEIADRAPIQANRVLSLLRKIYNFGLKRERVEMNPAHMVDAPAEEVSRDRIYSPDELKRLWATFQGPTGSIYKLILITGQREGEISGMRWDELDLEHSIWTVPAERMKSKKVHIVPLSDLALTVLHDVPRISDEFVFPSPTRPGQAIRNLGKAAKRVKDQSGIADFRGHDLRRTCGSGITQLGSSRFVMDRVLGHLEQGVGGRYDRHDYLHEKTSALAAWAERLEEILADKKAAKNVVKLRLN